MAMAIRSVRRRLVGGVLGGSLVLLLAGLGSAALAADHAIDIAGFAFSPQSITVAVGDTVTWTNADVQGHTATADDASFDTGTIGGGTSKTVTFSTAGTFAYHCRIHPAMTAAIVVSAATPPQTDTVAPGRQTSGSAIPVAVLAFAALGGLAIARRWFATNPAATED
jgi:plastocyanin